MHAGSGKYYECKVVEVEPDGELGTVEWTDGDTEDLLKARDNLRVKA